MEDDDFISFDSAPTYGGDADVVNREKREKHRDSPILLTSIPAPWLKQSQNRALDQHYPPFVHLHNEILTFCEYIEPTPDETKQRKQVLEETTRIVKGLWPLAVVSVFGSEMTQILTPSSDLDIAILNVPLADGEEISDILICLANKIKSQEVPIASYVEAVVGAKVPILKYDHVSGISVDIVINNDSGLTTGAMIRKLVIDYPPLRHLTIVLKIFLSQRNMNDTYSGGMGSFVLCAIVASFLQMRQKFAAATKLHPSWNLGALLLEFFQLYGVNFNYYTVGISIADGGSYFNKRLRSKSQDNSNRPNLLYIENPCEPDIDMGGNTFTMPKIKKAFEHAFQVLSTALSLGTSTRGDGNGRQHAQSYLVYVIRADDITIANRNEQVWKNRNGNHDILEIIDDVDGDSGRKRKRIS